MSDLALLNQELYGDEGNAILDIKFYPGEITDWTNDEIAATALAGITDIRAGNGEAIDLSI